METIQKSIVRSLRAPISRFFAYQSLRRFHSKRRSVEEIVSHAMKFPSSGYYRIDSIQIKSEFLSLVDRVQKIQPKVVLEIGTARGGTLFAWSQMTSDLVVSCDLNGPLYKSEFYKALPPPTSKCKVINLQGDSHDPSFKDLVRKTLNNQLVDFLFIDGDHTEKGVEQDFNDYLEFVRQGGLVAFHDIVENQPVSTNQVYYFWNRIKQKYPFKEYIDSPNQCGFGIGVIEV